MNEDEVIFLHHLAGCTIDEQTIVPRLGKVWYCKNNFYYTMNKFQGNMEQLGISQFVYFSNLHPEMKLQPTHKIVISDKEINIPSILLTWDQLKRMFEICLVLSFVQIMHKDLKLNNFLFNSLDDGSTHIVIADFGFALEWTKPVKPYQNTDFGWWHIFNCGKDLYNKVYGSASAINMTQFVLSLLLQYRTFVLDTETNLLYLFSGYNNDDFLTLLTTIAKNCSNFIPLMSITQSGYIDVHNQTKIPFLEVRNESIPILLK